MTWMELGEGALYLAAGAALGAAYFAVLLRTVQALASQAAAVRLLPLYLLRVALAVSVFWAIAQRGAVPLLLAFLGFLLARLVVQRRVGGP